ncbi:MAG TPA: CcmD family protein [Longimicrobiaceae bacterium]|nr:CcmD family protein [Longimicrobiaceae bacterium]
MPRLRLLALALAAVAAVSAAPASVMAQDSVAAAQPLSADSVTVDTSAVPFPVGAALPADARPPRTLRAYWHVFIAFALAWLLVFGYALSLGRRFRRLEKEVEAIGRGSPS